MPRVFYCLIVVAVASLPLSSFAAGGAKVQLSTAEYNDEKGGPLLTPEGVSCSDTTLYVADSGNGRVLRYSFQDGTVKGGAEIKSPQLPYPVAVQQTTGGTLLVLDGKLHRLGRVASDGAFTGFLDPQGVPAPAVVPRSFRVDSHGAIYLNDAVGARVVVLDPEGRFQRQIPFPKEAAHIADMDLDGRGAITLVDSINARVFQALKDAVQFTPLTPPLHDYLDFPVAISHDLQNRIYLIDQNGAALVSLGPDGSFQGRQLNFGAKAGFLSYPSGLCISRGDDVFIADRENNRFQHFRFLK
jgi:hypothetical protein